VSDLVRRGMLLHSPGDAATSSSATAPADWARAAEYEPGPYKNFADDVLKDFASIVPPEADVSAVADAIVKLVDTNTRTLSISQPDTYGPACGESTRPGASVALLLSRAGLSKLYR
jgi:hypothetical protein